MGQSVTLGDFVKSRSKAGSPKVGAKAAPWAGWGSPKVVTGSPKAAPAGSPKAAVVGSPTGTPIGSPKGGPTIAPTLSKVSHDTLALDGPSSMLSAAVQSAASLGEMERDPSAVPVDFRQILAEDASNKRSATTEDTKCSWGFDAMPSERPKGESVYSLQDREREEQAQLKELEDIIEIEAMFAALEVAEQEESRESLTSDSASASALHPGKLGAKPKTRGGDGRLAGSSRALADTKGSARSEWNEGGLQWSSWNAHRWSGDSWQRGDWKAAGWQPHRDSRQARWRKEGKEANGSHAEPCEQDGGVGEGIRWLAVARADSALVTPQCRDSNVSGVYGAQPP